MGSTEDNKLILYTNYLCPWAHRAQIVLAELGIPFETVIIDLDKPRTAEYLAINPRGLVPTINYNGKIIPESGIVSQFLADTYPSHLLKTSTEEGGALQRAEINFFIDAYMSKVNSMLYPAIRAEGAEKEEYVTKFVEAISKEVEGLLKNAGPYFGGSDKLTFAEVMTGSFVLRLVSFSKNEKLLPTSLPKALEEKTPNFWKWATAVANAKSVTYIWDEETVSTRTLERFGRK
ncbi:hypothetical protein BP6252_04149 [Coleophoma cylindrospora]|uniref:Thioredoxin-like protein n=1 Tax=Coleophoma cylindrospora TaxID=1849047 RepID=A0A3D8S0B4_9HELO|nr:hypothetical protein BP6252_04149 [Coleophoma cylindrospora]